MEKSKARAHIFSSYNSQNSRALANRSERTERLQSMSTELEARTSSGNRTEQMECDLNIVLLSTQFMFESPLRLVNWITSALLLLVLYQLFLMTRCFYWHQLVSVIGLLIFNYVILYRVLRDRWALQTVVDSREPESDDSDSD